MRHNPKHAETDPAIVRRMIRENPWATLVSLAGGLVASHYPILLDEESDELAIYTHVGKPDDQVHRFGDGNEMLLIVAGPHGYISPSWYAPGATPAPTWNFSTAHCYGVPEVLDAERNLAVLTRLVAHFERHVEDPVWLDQEIGARIARGTVGIRSPASSARSR
jgi:transcriptional regulator